MYPSFFRFKKLVDHRVIENHLDNNDINNNDNNDNHQPQQRQHYDYDSASIKNNLDEFKSLFKTQENACYELRSENTVLKLKLEVANEMIRTQSTKIKSLKLKKNKLEIENNVYKNVLCGSSLSLNNNNYNNSNSPNKCIKNEEHSSHTYPPPPPPPLPLPPPNKKRDSENFLMNNVLDELKSKIKKID
jgi:hypothetical protein